MKKICKEYSGDESEEGKLFSKLSECIEGFVANKNEVKNTLNGDVKVNVVVNENLIQKVLFGKIKISVGIGNN